MHSKKKKQQVSQNGISVFETQVKTGISTSSD